MTREEMYWRFQVMYTQPVPAESRLFALGWVALGEMYQRRAMARLDADIEAGAL